MRDSVIYPFVHTIFRVDFVVATVFCNIEHVPKTIRSIQNSLTAVRLCLMSNPHMDTYKWIPTR